METISFRNLRARRPHMPASLWEVELMETFISSQSG
ncbi:hypothetical protein CRC_03253 [Cylindrospermopsis raciborskii CS-505]|nr:hypothetical protein CRC_03253 [Cylindrospermopsis raciborskii CS-505]